MWCKWKRKRFSRQKWWHRCKKESCAKRIIITVFLARTFFSSTLFYWRWMRIENVSLSHAPYSYFAREKLLNTTATMKIKSSQVNQVDTTVQRCSNSSAIVFFLVVSNMSKSFCTRNIFYLHVNCELWTQPNVVELAWSKVETEGFRSSKSTNGNFKVLVGSIQFLAFFLPQSQTLKSIRPCISRSQTTTKRTPEISAFSTCLKF